MSLDYFSQNRFYGGASYGAKEGLRSAFRFGRNLNIFDDPAGFTINPASAKDSGSTVTDLIKWIVPGTPHSTSYYFYGDTGKIYQRTSGGTWSVLSTINNSGGQGLEVHDDYLYYTQDTQIGRYGLLWGSPSFTDNWQTGLDDTSTTNFAPIKAFQAGLAVGHGNNLAWWDGAVWTLNRLNFPPGFNVRSLEVIDEFLVIGTWRGTSVTDSEQGIIFFWDGTATTYNFFVEIPEGGVNAVLNSRNRLFSVVGSSGYLYLNYNPFNKVQRIPKLAIDKYVEIFPGAVTNWKGIVHFGISQTDSATIEHGVYQWGATSNAYPEVLNPCAYSLSTGSTTGTTVQIGSVKGIGDELYVGWKDASTYGVDRIVQTASPFTSAYMEGVILDAGLVAKTKFARDLFASHTALASGESVQLGRKVNRATSFTNATANSTVDDKYTRLPITSGDGQFNEFEWKVTLGATSTAPTVTEIALEFDNRSEEKGL